MVKSLTNARQPTLDSSSSVRVDAGAGAVTVQRATPRYLSPVPDDVDLTVPLLGAEWLGLGLTYQGEQLAGLMEARDDEGGALYTEVLAQMGRRATKTTAVMATFIGRAVTRPGYRAVITAQSGNIASRIMLEHAEMMLVTERVVESREARTGIPEGKAVLYRNSGRERLDFWNGSRVWVVPPEAGAVRSAASDDVWIDEVGEFEGARGQDFLAGAFPIMATRGPLAQLVLTGTPGKTRTGLLWEKLEHGRSGLAEAEDDQGTLDYSARDDDDPDDEAVWWRVYPGMSSLKADGTPLVSLKSMRKQRKTLGLLNFAREFLCLWPVDAATSALDIDQWIDHAVQEFEVPPGKSVIAIDAPKDQTCAAVLEVWRDDDGVACFRVLAFRLGVSWAPRFAHKAAREISAPVVGDDIGAVTPLLAELRRLRPVVRVVPMGLKQVGGAAQLLATEIKDGRVRHFDQTDLTAAVRSATWRPAGRESRAFMAKPGGAPVCPVVAASLGLWHFDELPRKVARGLISAP